MYLLEGKHSMGHIYLGRYLIDLLMKFKLEFKFHKSIYFKFFGNNHRYLPIGYCRKQ